MLSLVSRGEMQRNDLPSARVSHFTPGSSECCTKVIWRPVATEVLLMSIPSQRTCTPLFFWPAACSKRAAQRAATGSG